jgi:hypothetical protein
MPFFTNLELSVSSDITERRQGNLDLDLLRIASHLNPQMLGIRGSRYPTITLSYLQVGYPYLQYSLFADFVKFSGISTVFR